MKRSEMVDKIQLLLEKQSHQGTSYRFKALNILEFIEDEGMLPPPHYDAFYHDEPEWEDENE